MQLDRSVGEGQDSSGNASFLERAAMGRVGTQGLCLKPYASLLLMFIDIEKDEAERSMDADSLKPVL